MEASAQTCGYAKCELALASMPTCAGPSVNCECRDPGYGNGQIELRGCWAQGTPSYPGCFQLSLHAGCNCAAKPDLPPAVNIGTRSDGDRCVDGCLFTPKPPGSVIVRDSNGQAWASSENGWTKAGGAQCNSFANDPDEGAPTPDPIECGPEGTPCILPPEIPKFCGEINGVKMCADNGECEGSKPAGYICVGPPDASEPDPPPPPDGPPPNKPPDLQSECMINGQPCIIRQWGPNPEAACPSGWHRDANGNCVQDTPTTCPDGSQPVNGQCTAPLTCPDGSQPVQGQCVAPWANCPNGQPPQNGSCQPDQGVCPNGQAPVAGVCPATYGNCPNGQPPVNGMCQATAGTCPNGAQPVNGQCPVGQCNPATDPNQCQGNENGHASGGQTCNAPPACSGDLILCMNVQQTWQTRCAVERLAGDGSEPTEDDYGPLGDASQVWGEGEGSDTGVDGSGWIGGGGGACPDMGTVSFMGDAYAVVDWVPCGALRILAALILAGGFAQAAYIVGRG